MSCKEHVRFNIPTADDDNPEGMEVAALVIPDRDDTLHGFITLPKNVSVEDGDLVIRAIRACMAALEDNCHNHPTHPIRSE